MKTAGATAKTAVRTGTPELRWLVVCEDGRHVTLGRHRDPSEAEITQAGRQLDAVTVAGWLVVSEGDYHGRAPVALRMIRPITQKAGAWADAEARWQAQRAKAAKRRA